MEPLGGQGVDQGIVGEGSRLVLVVDDLLHLQPDDLPRHVLTFGRRRPAAKERLQRKQASWSLNPFAIDRPRHGRHVDTDHVGNLLHLQRDDRLWAIDQEGRLTINDHLGHSPDGVAPLLNRLHQPPRRLLFLLQVVAGLLVDT